MSINNIDMVGSGAKIELPVTGKNKQLLDELGVKWITEPVKEAFIALAELPCGWSTKEMAFQGYDKKLFEILDDKCSPRALVSIEMPFYAQKAEVALIEKPFTAVKNVKLELEFNTLLSEYNAILTVYSGSGPSDQGHVDLVYNKISVFAKKHPEFEAKIPDRTLLEDDESKGVYTAISMLCNNNHIREQANDTFFAPVMPAIRAALESL